MSKRFVLFLATVSQAFRLLIAPLSTPDLPSSLEVINATPPSKNIWTPEKCAEQAVKSRLVWADPKKRQKIIQSMRKAWGLRTGEPERPHGCIVFHLRHFPMEWLTEAGVCSWEEAQHTREAKHAREAKKNNKRIRAALRVLQIMPHYIGPYRYKDEEQKRRVIEVLAHFASGRRTRAKKKAK